MPNLTASERLGTNVGGRYEVRRLLGEGGFSSVFEAVHTFTGRDVALKILHPHLTTTEQITERFLMEARAMARINHDSIVQVLAGSADDLELLEVLGVAPPAPGHELGEAEHGVERRPELVAHVREERA